MAEIDSDRATVAARISFVTAIEGYPKRVKKDSVFAADHPIVIGNPTRFGPVNVRERPGTAASAAVRQAAQRPRPIAVPDPPTAEERIAELVRAHRDELVALATAAGVENAADLPNKKAIAEAIVAAVTIVEEPETPIVGGLADGAGHPATGPSSLEDATDAELAAIAAAYGVDVADDRDATIAAIRAAAGYPADDAPETATT